MSNVYVAGSSRDLEHVQEVQQIVRDTGHRLTYGWVPDVERYGPGARDKRTAFNCAIADMRGVTSADFLILVANDRLWGGMIELGMAAALHLPVWICEEWQAMRYSVFFELPIVSRDMSLNEVREALTSIAPVLDLQD